MMVKVITERKQFWISLGGGTGGVVGKPWSLWSWWCVQVGWGGGGGVMVGVDCNLQITLWVGVIFLKNHNPTTSRYNFLTLSLPFLLWAFSLRFSWEGGVLLLLLKVSIKKVTYCYLLSMIWQEQHWWINVKKSDDTKMLESPAGGDSAGVGGVEGGQCKEERAWWWLSSCCWWFSLWGSALLLFQKFTPIFNKKGTTDGSDNNRHHDQFHANILLSAGTLSPLLIYGLVLICEMIDCPWQVAAFENFVKKRDKCVISIWEIVWYLTWKLQMDFFERY